jgi:hypothetical protein
MAKFKYCEACRRCPSCRKTSIVGARLIACTCGWGVLHITQSECRSGNPKCPKPVPQLPRP